MLALAGGGIYYVKHRNTPSNTGDGINYGPPTSQEKQDAENNKKTIDQRVSQQNSASSPAKKTVTPIIVSYGQAAGYVKVSARVPGILENSGKCTLTLKMGGESVSQSKDATPNVSEMSCGFISIARSKLSAGTWTATVSYSSSRAKGVSEPQDIDVN